MKNLRRVFVAFSVCVILVLAASTQAAVKLPGVFGNNMVLQRDRAVPVWGWADPGETVTVAFAGQTTAATADAEGKWRVDLKPLAASAEAHTLTVTGKNTITLQNILVGEVWICSGQSNMEWALQGAANGAAEKAAANFPLIRMANVGHIAVPLPLDDVDLSWSPCTPGTAAGFSAVGYFFGRRLHQELNVPVGLIGANWGGTKIEPWTSPSGFAAVPELATLNAQVQSWDARTPEGQKGFTETIEKIKAWVPEAEKALAEGKRPPVQPRVPEPGLTHQEPTKMFNGMINPLTPFALRGAIWYQGESNGREGESYYHKMQALIEGWRKEFENPDLGFYFVQLANFQADSGTPAGGTGYAKIREAQRKSLLIPHTGMAVIIDVGESGNIHPRNKTDVGSRLAQWALAQTYGKDIVPSGPMYREQKVEDGRIRLSFDNVGAGLIVGEKKGLEPTKEVADGELKRFAVAGADKAWLWADAVIDGETILVSSTNVPAPVAVRYAYDACPTGCNLYNKEGLPASPFRTDLW